MAGKQEMVTWEGKWGKDVTDGLVQNTDGVNENAVYENMPGNLYQAFVGQMKLHPDRTAIISIDGSCYTYCQLYQMVCKLAAALKKKYKICPGKHVGVLLYNSIEFVIAYLAIVKLGAVYVSLPGKYQKPELFSLAEKAELDYLICEQKFFNWFAEKPRIQRILCDTEKDVYGFQSLVEDTCEADEECNGGAADSPMILMFTSGTTSRSKGVCLTNHNVMCSVYAYIHTLHLNNDETAIITTPMYHITGLVCIIATLLSCGGKVCILRKVDPAQIIRCLNEHKVTFFHASPTVFGMFLEEGARQGYPKIPSLTQFACGSGNMAPENIRRLKRWLPGADFHTVFGMTETSGAGTIFPCGAADSPYIGSSGIPMPDMKIRILDDVGNEMAQGQTGEICISGSFVMKHYYRLESEDVMPDGWLRTGDLGYVNEEGYLYIVDRKKDMINRGGEKIVSFDVENELHQLPGVLDAAVVGIPDPKYMEVPVAVVKMEEGYVWDDLKMRDILKTRLSRYMIPTQFLVLDQIPKTINGKVDKKGIRALFGT